MVLTSFLRRRFAAAFIGFAALATAVLGPAAEARPLVGVNVANPQWIDPAGQTQILDAVAASGVKVIRVPLRPKTVEFVIAAWKRGIETCLIVPLSFEAGAPKRKKNPDMPKFFAGAGLSYADPKAFEADVSPMLAQLEAAGVRLAAFELGNEINWAAFNKDFPVPGTGRVLSLDDLKTDPLGKTVAAGFQRYVETLKVLKGMRAGLTVNRDTPIISAGLVDPGAPGTIRPIKADAVALSATIEYLRSLGMDDYVDGYGVHLYPKPKQGLDGLPKRLAHETLAECGVKPCWLTEWGATWAASGCETHDDQRIGLIDGTLQALAPYEQNGEIAARILFNWAPQQGDKPGARTFSATSCGVLTDGAKRALSID